SIQTLFSTNCMAALPTSKPVYSGTVTARPASAPARAIQRTRPACRSRPSANSKEPTTIGVQMARLSKPMVISFFVVLLREPDEIRHEQHHTDQHHQRVVVEVAGLGAAHHGRDGADDLPAGVDHAAFDDPAVAALPQAHAQGAGAAREH